MALLERNPLPGGVDAGQLGEVYVCSARRQSSLIVNSKAFSRASGRARDRNDIFTQQTPRVGGMTPRHTGSAALSTPSANNLTKG
jgi:hypothetical protein